MTEDLELLKASIAVAVADGEMRRSELGVVAGLARRVGIGQASFDAMVQAAQTDASFAHSIFVPQAKESDLVELRNTVEAAMNDSRLVAIGEIGLDFFLPQLTQSPLREKQEHFYSEQLKIARDFDLPVLLHVRRSQDMVLKYLRRIEVRGGIAHAFNGSFQQAEEFIRRGFKLGFGGAMTFGGHGTSLGRRFLKRIQDEVQARAFPACYANTLIDFATLGGDAGFIGAAGFARKAFRP